MPTGQYARKPRKRTISSDNLRFMYESEGLSCREIGKLCGVSNVQVRNWLKADGTPMRQSSETLKSPRRRRKISDSLSRGNLDSEGYRVCEDGKRLHRQIAEAILARPLTNLEVVHHVNGCRSDNRPANLWVFPTAAAHTAFHKTGTIHPDTIKLIPYCGEVA
jgi:hypothetical protein